MVVEKIAKCTRHAIGRRFVVVGTEQADKIGVMLERRMHVLDRIGGKLHVGINEK